MSEDKKMLELTNYEAMAKFWDSNDLTDYWENTEAAEFEISSQARNRYLVSIDSNILLRIQKMARVRGIATESLVNLFLEQHVHQLEAHS